MASSERAIPADGDFCLVEDTSVPYEKIVQEVMAVPGCKSVGLLSNVATHVAIISPSEDTRMKVFSREELQAAAAAANEKPGMP
jgi:hypothetical protein